MTQTTPLIIRCPVCGAEGDVLRHDIRASLVYSCQACLHEWELDPSAEPDPPQAERTDSVTSTAVAGAQSASNSAARHRGKYGNAR